MGLDISFNAQLAVEKGAVITVDFIDYRDLAVDGHTDCEKVKLEYVLHIPGMGQVVCIDLYNAIPDGHMRGMVRANKWGKYIIPSLTGLNPMAFIGKKARP